MFCVRIFEQKVNYVAADMTDYAAVQSCIAKACQLTGPLDVVVANAGTGIPGYFVEQVISGGCLTSHPNTS